MSGASYIVQASGISSVDWARRGSLRRRVHKTKWRTVAKYTNESRAINHALRVDADPVFWARVTYRGRRVWPPGE